ncbi:MAG TPA: OsmC family protein [Pseudomonadales bacterium]|nr:OsmC family protein [Pseudomonadales bacterium]
MQATVRWLDEKRFVGESGSMHSVVMDGASEGSLGIRPMEMLLLGVGGCSSIDVMSMLQKGRQDVIDCRCELTAERVDAVPALFTKIHLHFVVTGRDIKDSQVKRAVELSAEKYCSASITMGKAGVDVSHSFEIVELA